MINEKSAVRCRCVLLVLAAAFSTPGRSWDLPSDNAESFLLQAGRREPRLVELDQPNAHLGLGLEGRTDTRFLIVAIHTLGLANRLRALASAIQVSQDSNRRLVLHWGKSEGCGAQFEDLFDIHSQHLSPFIERFQGDEDLLRQLVSKVNWTVPVVKCVIPGGESVIIWRPRGAVLDTSSFLSTTTSPRVIVLKSSGFFMSWNESCQEFYSRKRYFYQAALASLSPPVHAWRQALLNPSGPGNSSVGRRRHLVVGIHVRIHDTTHDWPVVAPQPGQSSAHPQSDAGSRVKNTAQIFDAVAPLDFFVTVMSQLVERFPGVHFFLASNSRNAKQQLVDIFGHQRISSVVNDGVNAERSTVEGVQRALVDWAVLSESALLVHSYGSSFAEEAAAVNLAPSLRLRVGGHVYGSDLSYPFCNNAVVENAFSSAATWMSPASNKQEEEPSSGPHSQDEACYHDASFGSERDRICTPVAQRSLCNRFIQAWGITDVYC